MAIESTSKHVVAVEVLAGATAVYQFEMVGRAGPVDGRLKFQSALGGSFHSHEVARILLVLVGIGCRIEGVGAIRLVGVAHLPIHINFVAGLRALIESVAARESAIVSGTVALSILDR